MKKKTGLSHKMSIEKMHKLERQMKGVPLTCPEIAALLGVTEKNIYATLRHAMHKLKAKYANSKEGFDVSKTVNNWDLLAENNSGDFSRNFQKKMLKYKDPFAHNFSEDVKVLNSIRTNKKK